MQYHSNPKLCPSHWCQRSWSWTVLWRPTRLSTANTKKDVLFIIGDWNAKVGSQEIPGVTDKFGPEVQYEAGQKLTELCWAPKNGCFWTVVLEKTLQSPLDCKEIKPVNPKGNQPWIFTGRIDAEAEAPMLWPPDAKNWLTGKDPDAGEDRRQKEKGTKEDVMFGWHHRLNGYKFEQALGVGKQQGSLACCSPWGCQESDTTEQLTNKSGNIRVKITDTDPVWIQN